MASLAISLLAISTVATVAHAQQSPNDSRDDFNSSDDATFFTEDASFAARFAAPAAGPAVASTAVEALSAGPREVGTTSGNVSIATSGHKRQPMVTDWSTKHMVFGAPKTEEQKARVAHNTRYKMQVARRNVPAFRQVADAKADSTLLGRFGHRGIDPRTRPTKASPLARDWSVALGGTISSPNVPSAGNSQFPAKFSFDINATPDCVNDFVVYNTNTPLVVAFNNLYSGTGAGGTGVCTGTGPNTYWAYNAMENLDGTTTTSVTLSFDATASTVIFVESAPSEGSVLHILRWKANDGSIGTPTVPAVITDPMTWEAGCTSCQWEINFTTDPNGAANGGGPYAAPDSNSAPYYDIDNDILYVGDDNGYIHKFINVLNGASIPAVPTEAAGNWPILMDTTANPAQTGPIYDSISSRVFAGNINGALKYINLDGTSGDLCHDGSTNYPCLSNNSLQTGGYLLPDPPIVDGTYGQVFVFQGQSAGGIAGAFQSPSNTCVCGTPTVPGPNVVFASFGGLGGAPLHSGDFDNNYYSTGTGYIYTCAVDATTDVVALRRIALATGIMSGTADPLSFPITAGNYNECSPSTEVYNPTGGTLGAPIDLLFFSVQTEGIPCETDLNAEPAGGCLMSFDLTAADSTPTLFPTLSASLPESGGTSGIVVDNVSTEGQASSIYFTPLGATGDVLTDTCATTGCAVKATQNGLN
jgi:hypothetical protein